MPRIISFTFVAIVCQVPLVSLRHPDELQEYYLLAEATTDRLRSTPFSNNDNIISLCYYSISLITNLEYFTIFILHLFIFITFINVMK